METFPFSFQNILFTKNVKRESGTDWAFYEPGTENVFPLSFSKTQAKGARQLMPGQIILLFQKVDRIPGIAKRTYLTHLVTPVDTRLHYNEEVPHKFKWERKVLVIARAEPRTSIFIYPADLSFRTPNRGKIVSIHYLNEQKTLDQIQRQIWEMFRENFNPNIAKYLSNVPVSNEDLNDLFTVMEGKERKIVKEHLSRERNPIIIGLAKAEAFRKGNGRIRCECCEFDFVNQYGDHGLEFIECHHIVPISKGGERPTSTKDLAMVCSNCHRMLHRKNQNGDYHSILSLKVLVQENRTKRA